MQLGRLFGAMLNFNIRFWHHNVCGKTEPGQTATLR
jgi:hypothetical protein